MAYQQTPIRNFVLITLLLVGFGLVAGPANALSPVEGQPRLVDDTGRLVSDCQLGCLLNSADVLMRTESGDFVELQASKDLLLGSSTSLYFTTSDCTGQAYIEGIIDRLIPRVNSYGCITTDGTNCESLDTNLYVPDTSTTPAPIPVQSRLTNRGRSKGCFSTSGTLELVPAIIETDLASEFTLPFRIVYDEPPAQTAANTIEKIENLIDADPDSDLAAKAQDAIEKLEDAVVELSKTPPDEQAAAGNIEGAIGELEAAVKDGVLDLATGIAFMNDLVGISRTLATDAVALAVNEGGDAKDIKDAEKFLAKADKLRAKGQAGKFRKFKDAANFYKDALSKADGAVG